MCQIFQQRFLSTCIEGKVAVKSFGISKKTCVYTISVCLAAGGLGYSRDKKAVNEEVRVESVDR